MHAKTVSEALQLGSYSLDLLFDYEKKLLWATGGPKRERPPDLSKASKEELAALTHTDKTLAKMYSKWLMWKQNFAVLEEHGMTRQQLKELNDVQDPEGGKDSIIVAIGRREAQDRAREILRAADQEGGRRITDDEMLSCLKLWGFKENTNRGNVMPDGVEFVHSDTVGLIKMSTCERTLVTTGSKRYPEFTQLVSRWLKEQLPEELDQGFTYTSVNLNKNYAGKLHRDGNNAGPSLIRALGDFTGGELNYWPTDDKKTPLDEFNEKDKVTLDIKENLLLFDGNRGHSVNAFQGERYTLVFFSVRTWNKVPQEEAEEALRCGIPVPNAESMAYAQRLLATAPSSYRAWPTEPVQDTVRVQSKPASGAAGGSEPKPSPVKTSRQTTKRASSAKDKIAGKKLKGSTLPSMLATPESVRE